MNKLLLETPLVTQCDVNACSYNVNSNCHARAITVGNGAHPGCDTFFAASGHVQNAEYIAGIGACKVSGCRFNDDLECTTTNIKVGMVQSQATCVTFTPR